MSKSIQLVEVIPVVKGITKPTLSYFTKESFREGEVVRVPVRNGTTLGIVSHSIDARTAKEKIKGSTFALRKLSRVERAGGLGKSFMQAAHETAGFYAAQTGNVLSALIPKKFLEKPELLNTPVDKQPGAAREVKLVQLVHEERFREYRGIVRESFARGMSVMFIVPTEEEVRKSVLKLSLGIEEYVHTPKTIAEARKEEHPVLFITTPSHILFDRKDLDTFIIERENSRAYRAQKRPYINIKKFLEYYARARGSQLILGDTVLSLETLWREREGVYTEFSPLSWRLKFASTCTAIDMKTIKEFNVFSSELKAALRGSLDQSGKAFLFALRKGVSSTTVCGDCGSVLLCKNCRSPMILHEPPQYICHHCGAKRSAETRCDHCNSWKLVPLGIGIDRVSEEAHALSPDADIFVMDKDSVKTSAAARALIKSFEESPKAILVGTELALNYLDRVPFVGVVTLDSLFSIPDFGINERVFYLLSKLHEIAGSSMLVQTRNTGEAVLERAISGNVLDFYREEIKEREETLYPPFSLFIKVTTDAKGEAVERKAAFLQSLFKDYVPHFSLGHELSMIIRVPRSEWPIVELRDKLLLLTPDFLIKVDPESIL